MLDRGAGEPSSSLYISPSFSLNEGTEKLERRGEIKEGKRTGTGELIPALGESGPSKYLLLSLPVHARRSSNVVHSEEREERIRG